MPERMKGLMGLCVRAGQGIFGEESCLKAMRSGQAALLLMDADASAATAEKYTALGAREGIPVIQIPAGLLAEATGRPGKAMAVRPGGFAERMKRLAAETQSENSTNDFNADKRQGV